MNGISLGVQYITSARVGLVSRASRIFRARGDNEKTEAKYTVWSDKTGFRFSWRNLWQSNEIARWLMGHVTTEKARD